MARSTHLFCSRESRVTSHELPSQELSPLKGAASPPTSTVTCAACRCGRRHDECEVCLATRDRPLVSRSDVTQPTAASLCPPLLPSQSSGMLDPGQLQLEVTTMPRGDKSAYTDKQKRQAAEIEEGYVKRGVSRREAERRAWATVNKETGGGKKSGSGRGKKTTRSSSRKGGKKGGRAAASRSKSSRSSAARKAASTRRRRAGGTRKSTGGSRSRKRSSSSRARSTSRSRSRASGGRSRAGTSRSRSGSRSRKKSSR